MIQLEQMESAIESVLFAVGDPISADKLSEIFETDKKIIRKMIARIKDKLCESGGGIVLLEMDDSFQLTSNPDHAEYVQKALEIKRDTPLSQAALEVLAIVAYNQPVSRSFVEQVRGVDSTAVIGNLVIKGLVEEAGRMNLPGKPIAYVTTDNFLRCFGLGGLSMLPPLPREEDMDETEDGSSEE